MLKKNVKTDLIKTDAIINTIIFLTIIIINLKLTINTTTKEEMEKYRIEFSL